MSEMSSKEGYGGAFVHGLFTTLLGTSCTAPFLASTLGYAVGQPAPIVVLLFVTIAAGMSLPYFLLTQRPAWMKYLPKPGAWMDRFKQVMGFVMLCVVVWLFSVFAGRGVEATAALSQYLLVLGFACWLLGVIANRGLAAVVALLFILGGYFVLLRGRLEATPVIAGAEAPAADGIPWQPFSDEKLARAVQRGEPVLIDFTADWCINCKFFERTVLKTDAVREAVAAHKVVTLKADWTNADPAITRKLSEFGRVGVPLYVLYRPGEEHPVVLDALTQQIILSNLSQIKGQP
jgi:thiol:disulfide interchange protein DsbD